MVWCSETEKLYNELMNYLEEHPEFGTKMTCLSLYLVF